MPINPYTGGDPNTFLQRNYGVLPSLSGRRFSGVPTGQVVLDSLMGYIDSGTGRPFTGALGTTGKFVVNGKLSDTDPNAVPKPDFQRNVLYPEIATPATALAKTIGTGSSLTPDFNKLATDYRAASDTALKSYDTAPLETEVRGLQKSYETGQGDVLSKFSDSNARYAQEAKDAIARLTSQLDKTESNIRQQAGAASSLGASIARFPGVGGSDTITSNNAGLAPRIARASLLPQLAAEERIGNQRYGQIANIEMPLNRELYGNDQGLLSFTAALNDKFRGDRFQIASFLNDVKTRMAAMPLQLQENYANYVLKLIGGEQAIAAGQLSNLSAAQRLIAASEYLERNIPEPATAPMLSYPVSTPGYAPVRQPQNVSVNDLLNLLAQRSGQPAQPGVQPVYPNPSQYLNRATPSIPFDPYAVSGGSAVVNGNYYGPSTGAAADQWWNDSLMGG